MSFAMSEVEELTEMLPLWSPANHESQYVVETNMEEKPTRKPKLLLQRAQDKTKGLRPDQVDEVSQSAQTLSAQSAQVPS